MVSVSVWTSCGGISGNIELSETRELLRVERVIVCEENPIEIVNSTIGRLYDPNPYLDPYCPNAR
jgi:hypothetical protein